MFNHNYDAGNVFAKIIRGEIPANFVAKNDSAVAFRDLNPQAPFHVLVIPRGEYVNIHHFIRAASLQEQTNFWKLAADVADLAQTDGFNVWVNTGESHGQVVPHFHIHILAGKSIKEVLSGLA